jgi:ribose transport system permease protein
MTSTTGDVVIARASLRDRFVRSFRGSAPIFLILLILLILITIKNPKFAEPGPFLAFIKSSSALAVLAMGQLFVIVSGEFDLSVGSMITVVVTVAAVMINGDSASTVPILGTLFILGVVVGLLNGLIVTRLRVPSFIATLGMLLILQGGIFYWTGGAPRGSLPDNFRVFGRGGISGVPGIGEVPWAVVILIVVGLVAYWLMHRTNFGRELVAIGGNARAAALAGIDVKNARTAAFVISAVSAVIAGILRGGFAGVSAQVGQGYEFAAISACVLGGAVLGGGRGSIPTAIAGALSLQALFVLLNLLGLPKPTQDAFQGLIIIAAVAYASYRLRGQA